MKRSTQTPFAKPAAVLVACLLALCASACGSDEDGDGDVRSHGTAATEAKAIEKAFLTTMVPHHESAIEMAGIAKEEGSDPFITELADDILRTQAREVARMRRIHERLLGTELVPDPAAHDRLGLTAAQAGMTHDAQTHEALRAADPFERAFVDQMIPHHEGAIRMADVLLQRTKDAELRRLAQEIVSAQRREIEQMGSYRRRRFGGRAPDAGRHEGQRMDGDRQKKDERHGAGHGG